MTTTLADLIPDDSKTLGTIMYDTAKNAIIDSGIILFVLWIILGPERLTFGSYIMAYMVHAIISFSLETFIIRAVKKDDLSKISAGIKNKFYVRYCSINAFLIISMTSIVIMAIGRA